jgi:hypothetical protein
MIPHAFVVCSEAPVNSAILAPGHGELIVEEEQPRATAASSAPPPPQMVPVRGWAASGT